MGLTKNSVGTKVIDKEFVLQKQSQSEKVIAIGGNPNVGKSTLFNGLTGLNQHTGNWPGKTVTNAMGTCSSKEYSYLLVDIPGTYSLMSQSKEEEVARDFICFHHLDGVVIVCDATCLERNLNLVLQTIEITNKVLVCVNLLDEAKKKKIHIDLKRLSNLLGIPVIGTIARNKKSLAAFLEKLDETVNREEEKRIPVIYHDAIEEGISRLEAVVKNIVEQRVNSRWVALKLIEGDKSLVAQLYKNYGMDEEKKEVLEEALYDVRLSLEEAGISKEKYVDLVVSSLLKKGEEIAKQVTTFQNKEYDEKDRKIDHILTHKVWGYGVMILLLALVFWLTITGANYPSKLLSELLFYLEEKLFQLFANLGMVAWLNELLVHGVYRVLAWVVSVMLPPMAIFFPLFTLLEDVGYLPRVAYNLDKQFQKCCACGKQALTICMGFGCNAAGIIGCRIIDSKRERLIAMLTNNFVPCNGRFPTLIAIITMFFIGTKGGFSASVLSAIFLTGIILLGIFATFFVSKILSKTILKGVPSSFTLELPPYRRPQIGKVLIRSFFDRTLFVLGRAISVAAPAGAVIWFMANVDINGVSILAHCSQFLDPFGRFLGLDGVILLAFILGLPANEIVVPIIVMCYLAKGSILELDNLSSLKTLLIDNGWTSITAISTMLFSLMHWPCSTTLLTIKKEAGGIKWMVLAFLIPTVMGILVCSVFSNIARIVF